jgi:EamA domain-containing membrane protein RarD
LGVEYAFNLFLSRQFTCKTIIIIIIIIIIVLTFIRKHKQADRQDLVLLVFRAIILLCLLQYYVAGTKILALTLLAGLKWIQP